MREFCEPIFIFLWSQEDLINELKSKNFETYFIPEYKVSNRYISVRSKINVWYQYKILKTPGTEIQRKFLSQYLSLKKRIKNNLKRSFQHVLFSFNPPLIKTLIEEEKKIIKQQPSYSIYEKFITDLNADGLFTVTPFYHEVELLARICKEKYLPIIASIHSFDNITKRGWPALFFDHYFVWNKNNKSELQRINPTLADKITIAGAPQMDFHFKKNFVQTKEEWLKLLNLPAQKKIILYGGGPVSLFPNEPQYLKHLLEALEKNLIEDSVILFRCHPLDKLERWKKYVGESSFIFFDSAPNGKEKLDYANVREEDIKKLISTLQYTDVHINLCSTMAVDGSVFNKPQIGPAYDDVNPSSKKLLRNMYYQEHYLQVIHSGAVHLADSKKQLIQLVNMALLNPEMFTKNCRQCVEEIITYTNGMAAWRVSQKLKKFFS